ncbi:Uncharacterised protein [Chlamydia trachomatis]|nr:Uncharacterised protein [Chlamydia trachomatis]
MEDRREINSVDAEILQVIQMFKDSFEVPAKKIIHRRFFTSPWFHTFGVVGGVSVRKSFRENLVPNCIFDPIRCPENFILMEIGNREIASGISGRLFEEALFRVNGAFIF